MELKFGTSGLRGRVVDMTDSEVHVNTLGFLRYLADRNEIGTTGRVALAEDLRESSGRIGRAVARAIRDAGQQPLHLGKVPTPALANCGIRSRMPCVMITGSHIPADRNGVKFYRPTGEVLKSDEPGILAAVARARTEQFRVHAEESSEPFDRIGEESYLKRYLDLFNGPLAGKKIVVYQHSAVGRDLLAAIVEGLGAEVIREGRSETFIAVDTEDVSVEEEHHYGEMVKRHGADAMVSTDGDGDRPLIVDEQGRFHRGDMVGAIVARWLKADYAAIPVSTSDAVDRAFAGAIELEKTRIGSPYVIEAMMQASARGKSAIVGWEANGGFLLGSDFPIGSGVLRALPTRDAVLPILAVLVQAAERRVPVSRLFAELPQRATRAGLLDEFPVEKSRAILARLDRALIEKYFDGFGSVARIESIDGLRIYFDNGDIAHLRPSGNAPQFRIYTVSDTQARADQMVDLAVGDAGILRRMERELGS
jgi:phosphomannomutase